MDRKILKLSVFSKIIFSLYTLISPLLILMVIVAKLESESVALNGTLSLIGFFLSIICFIWFISGSQKYIILQEKKLYVCKGKKSKPQVLETIDEKDIVSTEDTFTGLNIICTNNKRIKIVDWVPILICLILTLGPIALIFAGKVQTINSYFSDMLENFKLSLLDYSKKEKTSGMTILINILSTVCLLILIPFFLIATVTGMAYSVLLLFPTI